MPLAGAEAFLETRGKVMALAEAMGADRITAVRIATGVSEIVRVVGNAAQEPEVCFMVDSDVGGCRLVLDIADMADVELVRLAADLFDRSVSRRNSDGRSVLRLESRMSSSRPDAGLIAQLRRIVGQRSRERLMAELQAKHRELEESFETLKRTTSAKERMESELNIGRDIQMSMLPVDFDTYAQRHEFELFASLFPAREVGGDFYDFFLIDEDRLCVCVGDVSGKGVPAALFMAMTKTLVKSRASNDFSPASILTHVNDELGRHNESCMFVTVWLAIIDVRTGRLSYCNAGHNPPYIRRAGGELVRLEALHGPVIAAMDAMNYGEDAVELAAGDVVLLYTDGVTEAQNGKGELYGEPALVSFLEARTVGDVRDIVDATVDEVWRFQGDAEQADDVTVLAVRFNGGDESSRVLELSLNNDLAEIAGIVAQLNQFAERQGLEDAVRRRVNMAVDELLNNIVSYGFDDEEAHPIHVRMELGSERLSLTITDDGQPFNPFARNAPDVEAAIDDREIGGLGIHLVQNVMDEVAYRRRTEQNVVTLIKYLNDN
jgi:sigma-B regulation protein RsbU (phosphoserine phosphatase)